MHRLAIYKKDVRNLTGKNSRQAEYLLYKIRARYNKKKSYQFIAFWEFAEFTGIDEKKIIDYLKLNPMAR